MGGIVAIVVFVLLISVMAALAVCYCRHRLGRQQEQKNNEFGNFDFNSAERTSTSTAGPSTDPFEKWESWQSSL